MKRLLLLSALSVAALSANAQLSLAGASPYTQNFNSIGGGLPNGWTVYIGATDNSLGTLGTFNNSATFGVYDTANLTCTGSVRAVGFKNYASANVSGAHDSCGLQSSRTDRALGVRQVGPTSTGGAGFDSGATFVLKLANTYGMSGIGLNFKLQSLDITSPRTTNWKLQYGLGSNPTSFTDIAATGTMTTGGQTQVVVIRLVTLVFSSGSGNRASTAIDDFNLTWTGMARTALTEVSAPNPIGFTVLGDATANAITFGYQLEDANGYTISLYDLAGRQVATTSAEANNTTMSNINLAPGFYIAKLSNGTMQATTKVAVK
ncbi:MAG: T9SS C-terminal target domain-containing protein [Chitinophagia bacterium]|nr:T9SS C-terminal target domain-containing protein [Chitinophagia bacterium]